MDQSLEGGVQSLGLALGQLLGTQTGLCESRGVRVEAEKDLLVAKRVLLLDVGALGDGAALDGAEHRLDL